MDTIKILKSILGGNATGSKRVEEIQRRPSSGGQSSGGLGDVLGSVLGNDSQPQTAQRPKSNSPEDLGNMLEDLLGVGGAGPSQAAPTKAPPARRRPRRHEPENDQATVLIRAMCNAAKVDGDIDRDEQDAILGRLGEVTQDEIDFVRRELSAPLDIDAYCDSVPDAASQNAYAFSVMAIKLDTLNEAAYLGRLAAGLELDTETCNQIHKKIGAPSLYS